jgi:flagellar biosynthesis/type III secretory pathway M-ring protein FliF/YscJ
MQDVDIPRLSEEDEELQKVVSQLAEENPAAVAEIIQMWLNQSEK